MKVKKCTEINQAPRKVLGVGDLSPIFRPKSVALIGVSGDPRKLTGAPLRNLVQGGFPGKIYPVNPKYNKIGELPCVRSIEDLPDAVDVALIMLAARDVPAAVRAWAA